MNFSLTISLSMAVTACRIKVKVPYVMAVICDSPSIAGVNLSYYTYTHIVA